MYEIVFVLLCFSSYGNLTYAFSLLPGTWIACRTEDSDVQTLQNESLHVSLY